MKIGIISDSHDNVPVIKAAVDLFNSEGVGVVLHCGDFVAPFALLPFKLLNCQKLVAVFGNCDGEKKGLKKVADENGWTLEAGPFEFELVGRKVVIMHNPDPLEEFLSRGGHDLMCYGHLHKIVTEKKNGAWVINPGEAGGWLTKKSSVVVMDFETFKPTVYSLNED